MWLIVPNHHHLVCFQGKALCALGHFQILNKYTRRPLLDLLFPVSGLNFSWSHVTLLPMNFTRASRFIVFCCNLVLVNLLISYKVTSLSRLTQMPNKIQWQIWGNDSHVSKNTDAKATTKLQKRICCYFLVLNISLYGHIYKSLMASLLCHTGHATGWSTCSCLLNTKWFYLNANKWSCFNQYQYFHGCFCMSTDHLVVHKLRFSVMISKR